MLYNFFFDKKFVFVVKSGFLLDFISKLFFRYFYNNVVFWTFFVFFEKFVIEFFWKNFFGFFFQNFLVTSSKKNDYSVIKNTVSLIMIVFIIFI